VIMNSSAAGLVIAAVVGLLIGALAELAFPNPRWGMAGGLLVGAVGALLGGSMLKAGGVRVAVGSRLGDAVALAVLGAVLVLGVARLMGHLSGG
jgi:uncharacterized membrane protein YeaQ/YmgE (transglycosylase-associated protein family)